MQGEEQQAKPGWGISRDEMNLAEFPLALLSTRADPNLKTLEFSDTVRGKNGELTQRQWIITGADKFGLPTALDDEVLLGLLKLTVDDGFRSQKVVFTRYELLRILRWSTEGRSYQRLQRALDRLSGVRIKATNAFYDNAQKAHHTKNFGIIDAYELSDGRENAQKPSFFIWSETIFDSFQVGFIKKLDLEFYLSLNSSVSKRLYRFLDKHFWYRSKVQINLFTLAHEKIGVSRNYRFASSLKQQLQSALDELIDRQFLGSYEFVGKGSHTEVILEVASRAPKIHGNATGCTGSLTQASQTEITTAKQITRTAKGRVTTGQSSNVAKETASSPVFSSGRGRKAQVSSRLEPTDRAREALQVPVAERSHELVLAKLVERGIGQAQAVRLVMGRSAANVEKMLDIIDYFDGLVASGSSLISRNPVGWLYRMIERVETVKLPGQAKEVAAPIGAKVGGLGSGVLKSSKRASRLISEVTPELRELYEKEYREAISAVRGELSTSKLQQIEQQVRLGWASVRSSISPAMFEASVAQGVEKELAKLNGFPSLEQWVLQRSN